MKKMNKKGFTLIELLAVIVILGLLMAIAIPSVTRYITQSRKKTLVNSINSFITSVTNAVNNMEFGSMSSPDKLYYVKVSNKDDESCVQLEKGGSDPFGEWGEAYVAVHYNPTTFSYDYYFTFYDKGGYGMALTKSDDMSTSGSEIVNPTKMTATTVKTQISTAKGGDIKYTPVDGGAAQPVSPVVITPSDGVCVVPTT